MPTGQGVGYDAAVGHEVDLGGLDGAVAVEGHLDLGVLVAGLPCREQVLLPVLDPLHRAGSFGAASIRHISSRCTMIFWPKPPPVSRAIDPDPVLGDAEQPGAEHARPRVATALPRRW